MRPFSIASLLLLGSLATVAGTQTIAPRQAEAVQPRQAEALPSRAEAVQARQAEAVQPRQAEAVQPRHADPVSPPPIMPIRAPAAARDTAVQGRPGNWQWQDLGHSSVAGDGVARGSQLKNVRCAGVACRMFADSAGAWVIRAEGGFPQVAGNTLEVLLMNLQTRRAQVDSRARGVFSDGSFWDQLDTWQLPAGSYALFYKRNQPEQVLATITFDVEKHERASTVAAPTGAANGAAERQRLREAALRNQRCLTMAATNPDVTCVSQ